MSSFQTGNLGAPDYIKFMDAPISTRSSQMLQELFELASMNGSTNAAKNCIARGATITLKMIIHSLELAHFLKSFTYYTTLLDVGLDVNTCLGSRGTALTYAVFQNDPLLVSYLLQASANPNSFAETSMRSTALDIAVSMGSVEIALLLCKAGAELNGERSELLQRAAQRGDAEMVAVLLDYGAEIDHIPTQCDLDWLKPRSTALHEACSSGSRAVILMLIERGADIEAKDWSGKTVLDRAMEMGPEANDIVATLRNHLVTKVVRRCDW
jgi:ankyrin repeat protein